MTVQDLYKKYDLSYEDAGKFPIKNRAGEIVKEVPMIWRSGIEKIQAKLKIEVDFELLHISPDQSHCVIKATGKMKDRQMQTLAEASPDNCKNKYPVMTCEKRALGRVVLKLAGLYEHGVFAEGENLIDDNEKPKPSSKLKEYALGLLENSTIVERLEVYAFEQAIENGTKEQLEETIAHLKGLQKDNGRKSAKEINKAVAEKVGQENT